MCYDRSAGPSDRLPSDDDVETTVGLNIGGMSASQRKSKSRRPERSLRKKLEILGKSAAKRESAVLLCVDELQGGQRDELRRLSSDLQRLTKEDGLPIAFIGAGLPSVAYGIMRDSKMTFFQRCHTHTLPPLDDTSVAMFFHRAIRDADGICEPDVIQRMTHAVDGFPYKMQIIGNNAWQFAEAPRQPIDAASAELAISAAEHLLNSTVYRHVWETLSPTDQQILRTVASHGGRIARRELGAAIPVSSSYLTSCVNRLVDYGCVTRPENFQSDVRLGTLAPFNFVTGIVQEEAAYKPPPAEVFAGSRAAKPGSRGRPRSGPRCGERLKTKNVNCILPAGHNGNCRSR